MLNADPVEHAAHALEDLALLAKMLVAMVLSAAIGWERERRDRPAGLRTHMLVGASAALFVMLGEAFVHRFDLHEPGNLRFDPLRIIEATVAGVSFLGAGTIFVSRNDRVRGLTTAASLLATVAIGMGVALERYVLSVGATALLLMVLAVLRRFEHHDASSAGGDGGDQAGD